jgi:hypothetical protein
MTTSICPTHVCCYILCRTHTQGMEEKPPSSSALAASTGNDLEARLAALLAAQVLGSMAKQGVSIGIITPYRYQVQLVQEQLAKAGVAGHQVCWQSLA